MSESVYCPACQRLLPVSEMHHIVDGLTHDGYRVGFCTACWHRETFDRSVPLSGPASGNKCATE